MNGASDALISTVEAASVYLSNLSDAQTQQYGRYLLAVAAAYYLSTSFKAAVPADAKYAIEAHLPQGYDRSVIAARLEQRHAKTLLQDCLKLQQLRDALRGETSREAKLKSWEEVFRRTLTGLVAGSYTHSLTLSLFAVKNTVRVLIFVLRRREEAEQERQGSGNGSGPLSKVKAWWSGGTQTVLMNALMSRMTSQMERQASPFANAGLDEEPLPMPPAMGGHDAFMYSQMISQELADADDVDDLEERGLNDGDGVDEDERTPGTVRNTSCISTSSSNAAALSDAAAVAEAKRLFSVKEILDYAIPKVVATAAAVVARVLARQPAGAFSAAGSVSSTALRALLAELCAEMERAACVAEWLHFTREDKAQQQQQAATERARRQTSLSSWREEDEEEEDGEEEGEAEKANHRARATEDGEADGIVRFPAGSTTMLGPDGRPLPRHDGANRTNANGHRNTRKDAAEGDDQYMRDFFGATSPGTQSSPEARRLRRAALRQDLLVKTQTAGFFQELIHSASFGELCLQYAEELLVDAFFLASDISGVKSYDAETDSAKTLLVITALEGHRQKLFDMASFEVQASMKLFCEETVRSTCTHS